MSSSAHNMTSASELLNEAVRLHRGGELERADAIYRQVLELEPTNARAHDLLGVSAMARGRAPQAIEHFARAVEADQTFLQARQHLAAALAAIGRFDQTAETLRQALALAPRSAALHNELGTALRQIGESAQGGAHYQTAIALDPNLAEAHNNLGNALHDRKQYQEAIACFERAAQLRPDAVEVHFNLGNTYRQLEDWKRAEDAFRRALALRPTLVPALHGLGVVLHARERYEAAAETYREALRLDAADVESHLGLGGALQGQHRFAEAEACFRYALALKPNDITASYNLGGVLFATGDYPQAEGYFRSVLERSPEDVELYFRLGQCMAFQGRFDDAECHFNAALARDSNHAECRYYRAAAWLTRGDFARGWPEYEWRLKTRYSGPPYPQPRWDGRPLNGERILLHSEWGFGDTLHFLRYVPLVQKRGGDVFLEVQPGLIPLLTASGFTQLIPKNGGQAPADVRWQLPILSLPGVCGTTLETIPAEVPYLKASAALVEQWSERLKPCAGLRVGIHWHGSKAWATDPRSIPLAEFAPLAAVDGVTLISLQKHDDQNQIAQFASRWSIVDFGDELDAVHGAFMDTAAIMTQLDLVVTCDTGTTHVAGALGVPTWVALPRANEWRWMWDRPDSPWYPTMRLFRQPRPFDWRTPFEAMAAELTMLARAKGPRTTTETT